MSAYFDADGETLCKFNAKGAAIVDFVQGFHHIEKAKKQFLSAGGTSDEFSKLLADLTEPDPEMME